MHRLRNTNDKSLRQIRITGTQFEEKNLFNTCQLCLVPPQWTVGGLYRMALFAVKDILPGEEICYDYNFSLFNTDQGQECKCGAKSCRGVIGGKGRDFLITLKGDDASSGGGDARTPNGGGQQQQKVAVATDPAGQVLADEKWFRAHMSEEDMAWVEKHAPKFQQLEAKTIKCTVCNECLNFKLLGQVQRHPELGKRFLKVYFGLSVFNHLNCFFLLKCRISGCSLY